LSYVTPPLQDNHHSITSLLYGTGGVVLFQMGLQEAMPRNKSAISYYHHIQIQRPALTKDAELALEIRLLSISI